MPDPLDPLDEKLRQALVAAAAGMQPSAAPGADAAQDLLGRVRQRRRRHRLAGAGMAVVSALVVLVAIAAIQRPGSTTQRVHAVASGRGAGDATTVANPDTAPVGTTPISSDPTPATSPCPATGCGGSAPAVTATAATTPRSPTTAPTPVVHTTTTRPTTTSTALPGALIIVTEADSGSTVTLHAGQSLRVALAGSAGMPWSLPVDSDTGILQPEPSGVFPTQGSVITQYRGAATGQATVTAIQDPLCRASVPPCAIATRGFSVTVNVVS